MKKKYIVLSSLAVFMLLSFNACDSTARDSVDGAKSGIKDGTDNRNSSQQPVISDNPKPFKPVSKDSGTINSSAPSGNNGDNNVSTDNNNSSATVIKTINGTYSIKITPEFDSMTAGQTQNVHYEITNFFTKKPADNSVIKNLKFEIDEKYAEFFDPQGNHGDTIEFKNGAKSVGDIAIKSTSLSGQVRMNFNAVIDNTDINLTKSFPITIEKNKSSSMAIVPYATEYDGKGLFIQKYVIHVVDSYGNKAKDGTTIQTGVINNPKLYSRAYNGGYSEIGGIATPVDDQTLPETAYGEISKNDWNPNERIISSINEKNETVINYSYNFKRTVGVKPSKDDRGSLDRSKGTFKINPKNPLDVINNQKITQLDTLIILANKEQHKPYNLGGWDIKSVNSSDEISLLDLESDVSNVSYVIGDEYRYDRCRETIMNAAASTFKVTKVVDGVAYAELRYTPAMVGKNVFIYANSKLDGKRIGVSRKVLLTGTGLNEYTLTCKNEDEKGSTRLETCSARYRMIQNDSGMIAREVYIAQPVIAGQPNYRVATATKTDCSGWTTVTIYGVPAGKSASVKIGGKIATDELIVNQR